MMLLTLSGVSKSFGDNTVLNAVSLMVNAGERFGVVGANGVGKSTLLKVIVGEVTPEQGVVTLAPGVRMGYLPQTLTLLGDRSVAELLAEAQGDLSRLAERMRTVEQAMSIGQGPLDDLLVEYGALSDQYELAGGYQEHNVEQVLAGLGLAEIERSRPVSTLSGGEKERLGLAGLLLRSPDLLLLDEPTNHLDFAALEWLEDHLQRFKGGLVAVSHDRHFLNRMATTIVEIDEVTRAAKCYAGDYDFYAASKQQERARWLAEYEAQQEEMRELRRIIRVRGQKAGDRHPMRDSDGYIPYFKAQRVDAAVSRNIRSAEEKLRRLEENPIPRPPKGLEINPELNPTLFGSKTPVNVVDASKSYGERIILHQVACTVESRARIVLVGPNGAGKTTLLRIMARQIAPDSGWIYWAPGVAVGYLDQEQETLDRSGTLYEVYTAGLAGDWETLKTELLSYGLFTYPELAKPVAALSVGQKRKLQLARLMATRANVLLLDEPTNHISLDVLEEFEAALHRFAGPIVAVSHDRRFIQSFADEVWEIIAGALVRYVGGWDEYQLRHQ
jgi:macrolide transport system ATP-binding/permease protein